MATRIVRIYDSPDPERAGTVIGFGGSTAEAAYDPSVHSWFREHGYQSLAPLGTLALMRSGGRPLEVVNDSDECLYQRAYVPIPPESSSDAHLFVEPPLNQDDTQAFAKAISGFSSCDSGNHFAYLYDSRVADPNSLLPQPNPANGQKLAQW
jgi:hypothetical protein